MATEELNPASENAKGPELPPMMPLGQIGAHGANPDADAAWLSAAAMSQAGDPKHTGHSYQDMSHNPPGEGAHNAHPYDTYKHQGCE